MTWLVTVKVPIEFPGSIVPLLLMGALTVPVPLRTALGRIETSGPVMLPLTARFPPEMVVFPV